MDEDNMNRTNEENFDQENNESESIWTAISDYDEKESLSTLSSPSSSNDDSSDEDLGSKEEASDDKDPISRRKLFTLGGVAFLSSIPLGIGAGYVYQKTSMNKEGTRQLNNVRKTYGKITPVNTLAQVFDGQMLENVNIDQKSLVGGANNTASESAVFIFSNGKNSPKRSLDVFIDFDSQRSRDFMLINQSSLKSMIENGLIELRVHPVSSGSALSIYSPEALAESFLTSPEKSWNFMLSLLKLSAEVQADGDIDILPAIEEKIKESGVTDISAESIKNGTFSSWIIAVGDDPRLDTGYYPPIIYINETIVDPDVVDFNDTDSLRRYIIGFDTKE